MQCFFGIFNESPIPSTSGLPDFVGKDAKNVSPMFSSGNAVDGRNPAPVDVENLPLFPVFYTSQVVQDFFHQYVRLPMKDDMKPMICFLYPQLRPATSWERPWPLWG